MNCASATDDRLSLLPFRGCSSLNNYRRYTPIKKLSPESHRPTLIGQQFKVAILRLDEDQPHLAGIAFSTQFAETPPCRATPRRSAARSQYPRGSGEAVEGYDLCLPAAGYEVGERKKPPRVTLRTAPSRWLVRSAPSRPSFVRS